MDGAYLCPPPRPWSYGKFAKWMSRGRTNARTDVPGGCQLNLEKDGIMCTSGNTNSIDLCKSRRKCTNEPARSRAFCFFPISTPY